MQQAYPASPDILETSVQASPGLPITVLYGPAREASFPQFQKKLRF